MKPKVALVKDGFLPAGSENVRGRLSREALVRLDELSKQGWDIDGYGNSIVEKATRKDKSETTVLEFGDLPPETRPESEWQARSGNVEIGMRTVCNNCHASLTYCHCEMPKVWLDFDREGVVSFKPRTTPLKRR